MKTVITKKAGKIAALFLLFILCVATALLSAAYIPSPTYSADEGTYAEISGDTAGVDIYISGDGVTFDEARGQYLVPQNTRVEITVVNDAMVSDAPLEVTDDVGKTIAVGTPTANFAVADVGTQGIRINVSASLDSARGRSLSSAYLVSTTEDLIALSKLLAARDSDFERDTYQTDGEYYDIGVKFAGYLAEFGMDEEGWYNENGDFAGNGGTVKTAVFAARQKLSTSYFRLANDVIINASLTQSANYAEGYFGLGSRRGVPFAGVFDFNGYAATMNVSFAEAGGGNFNYTDDEMTHSVLSIGFFNYIYGDGSNACAIIDADVRGTIALSADADDGMSGDHRVYVGGVAGSIGKNVAIDGAVSRVSISARAGEKGGGVSVYAGGVFGYSGADIDYWSDVSYVGNYSEISVTCAEDDTSDTLTMVGGLAGVVQNAYVNGFKADLRGANILADSTINGSALAGGLAGIIYGGASFYPEIGPAGSYGISGITVSGSGSTVSAVAAAQSGGDLDPDDISGGNSAAVAVAGGLIGMAYVEDGYGSAAGITISDVDFVGSDASGTFSVRAATADGNSRGMTFAGGAIGYVVKNTQNKSVHFIASDAEGALFSCPVSVSSVQNGKGPAYAGGIFGYNAFTPSVADPVIRLNDGKDCPVDVLAEQTETASNAGDRHGVFAGLFTSLLQNDYTLTGFTFGASGSSVTARRLTGSTAVGDIAAGALAGKASSGTGSGAVISDIKVTLEACSVNALGYSFASDLGEGKSGNNVYAGGVIGHVKGYGRYDTKALGISGVSLDFSGVHESGYAVRGVQNAKSGNADYCTEGYVGGMFGMAEGCYASGLSVSCAKRGDAIVYFNSTNNPNTASVGGLIGATRVIAEAESAYGYRNYALENSSVSNMHVAGRAYIQTNDSGWTKDIYVGGAVGVFGTANNGVNCTNVAAGIRVNNCSVEAIGEEAMLTYAGGVFGGIWWVARTDVSGCESTDNDILASSATFNTFAGGISGMVQRGSITSSKVIDTDVEAITYSDSSWLFGSNVRAYASGICPRVFSDAYLQNNISNAFVTASAPDITQSNYTATVMTGVGVNFDGANTGNNRNNYFVAANVNASSFTEAYAFRNNSGGDDTSGSGNYAVGIVNGGTNRLSSNDAQEVELTTDWWSSTQDIYSGLGLDFDTASNNSINSTMAGSSITVRVVGDSVTLSRTGRFSYAAEVEAKQSGTSFGQILVQTADGGSRLLCSYPITVNAPGTPQDVNLSAADLGGEDVNAGNTNNFSQSGNITYFQIYAGKEGTAQEILASTGNVYTPNIYFVKSGLLGYSEGATNVESTALQIVQNKGNLVYPDDVSGYFNIRLKDDGTGLYVSPVLGKTDGAALVLEYIFEGYNDYIVIEVVPNAITGVTLAPAEDTPARAEYDAEDGTHRYVYSSGDTVRIEATVNYRFGFNRYIVDVQFTGSLSSGSGNVDVQPNGTVMIGTDVANNSLITVECTPIVQNMAVGDAKAQLTIEVARKIVVTPDVIGGASYSPQNDNDAVNGHEFTFLLEPNPGYGLNPTLEFILENSANAELFRFGVVLPEKRVNGSAGSYEWSVNGGAATTAVEKVSGSGPYYYTVTVTHNGVAYDIVYGYDGVSGMYAVTLPAELFEVADLAEIRVNASFSKMYSVMFDVGDWVSAAAGGSLGTRYFIYHVKADTPITTALRDEIFAYFDDTYGGAFTEVFAREGFTFKGFFMTDSASSSSSYGISFVQYCENGDAALEQGGRPDVVRGSMNYYARWNYTVVLNAPVGVSITGGLAGSLLESGGLIPIDVLRGFSLKITGSYSGIPRVSVFTYRNGALVEVGYALSGGVYTVSAADVTGTIYVYISGDNLAVVAGENDNDDSYTQSIDLRSDGVFTVRYEINHGNGDAQKGGSAAFDFSRTLPEGTAVRLFYQINGKPYSVGSFMVPAGGTARLAAAEFKALPGSPATAGGWMDFDYAGELVTESYYLVITLPNNSNAFGAGALTVTATAADVNFVRTEFQTEGVVADESQKDKIQRAELSEGQLQNVLSAKAELYGAAVRGGSYADGTLSYTVTDNGGAGAPEDIRHRGKYYVWRIEGSNVTVGSGADWFSTDVATYVIIGDASAGNMDITLGGNVTSIKLMEVGNSQYPAEGSVLAVVK